MVNWKLIAIIFIILFVVETGFIFWAYNKGTSMERDKIKCSNEICAEYNSDAFVYDDYMGVCSCYKDNEIIKQVVFK